MVLFCTLRQKRGSKETALLFRKLRDNIRLGFVVFFTIYNGLSISGVSFAQQLFNSFWRSNVSTPEVDPDGGQLQRVQLQIFQRFQLALIPDSGQTGFENLPWCQLLEIQVTSGQAIW